MKSELPILKYQSKQRTNVYWLLKKDIPKIPEINNLIKSIGTIDFAIVDDEWVFRAFLDKKRNVKYVNVIKNKNITKNAKLLMDELLKIANKINNS